MSLVYKFFTPKQIIDAHEFHLKNPSTWPLLKYVPVEKKNVKVAYWDLLVLDVTNPDYPKYTPLRLKCYSRPSIGRLYKPDDFKCKKPKIPFCLNNDEFSQACKILLEAWEKTSSIAIQTKYVLRSPIQKTRQVNSTTGESVPLDEPILRVAIPWENAAFEPNSLPRNSIVNEERNTKEIVKEGKTIREKIKPGYFTKEEISYEKIIETIPPGSLITCIIDMHVIFSSIPNASTSGVCWTASASMLSVMPAPKDQNYYGILDEDEMNEKMSRIDMNNEVLSINKDSTHCLDMDADMESEITFN
jgi:hypothetical protein